MKFKKLRTFVASMLLTLTFGGVVLAEEPPVDPDPLPPTTTSENGVFTPGIQDVSAIDDIEVASGSCYPMYKYKTAIYEDGNFYSKSTSDAYKVCSGSTTRDYIKYIYAKTRLYRNGAFVKSATDGSYGATSALITAYNNSLWKPGTYEGYGNHTFKKAGYADHYFQTYTKYKHW
ncbi:hypothetical protein [Ectobacillus antri]|uniref:hypothetical protein n=1 Tax=Ectobacillus antri TaxID=2486280 RepID=UPI000F597B6C|nr:hypothetical protein [Ectobacillus antri]